MMRAFLSLSYVLAMAALSCYAQESHLQSDFRREADDLRTNCTSFNLESMTSCGQVLFTGAPLHIAVGSLAPQNGVGFGPAFVAHSTPNELWRLSWNVDAVGTMNGSWRAGVYMKAIRTPVVTITPVISGAGTPPPSNLTVRDSTVFNLYTQAISLNTVDYELGPSTARNARAILRCAADGSRRQRDLSHCPQIEAFSVWGSEWAVCRRKKQSWTIEPFD